MTALLWAPAQMRLAAAGYDPGPPDGVDGVRTWAALLDFTAGRKLGEDGLAMATCARDYLRGTVVVSTAEVLADFLAQNAHETGGLTKFVENLNYSAQGLANTWPGRYAVNPKAKVKVPNARALKIARNPEAIGNDTYALRMGNLSAEADNDVHPDGFQYRGRSTPMLTGRSNYDACGKAIGIDLITNPDLAASPAICLRIALWFWETNRVARWIVAGQPTKARAVVNAGNPDYPNPIGLDDVNKRRVPLLKVLGV